MRGSDGESRMRDRAACFLLMSSTLRIDADFLSLCLIASQSLDRIFIKSIAFLSYVRFNGKTAGTKNNDRILRYGLVNSQTHFEDPQLFIGTIAKGLVRFGKGKGALSLLTGCDGGMQYNQVVEL